MSDGIRSRRAGIPREQARLRPLYARILGLQFLNPSGFLCFVFFEGAVALGILLALAELVSWWGVLVLPVVVALMVKLNDVVAGALTPTTVLAGTGGSGVRAGVSASGAGLVVRPASGRTSDAGGRGVGGATTRGTTPEGGRSRRSGGGHGSHAAGAAHGSPPGPADGAGHGSLHGAGLAAMDPAGPVAAHAGVDGAGHAAVDGAGHAAEHGAAHGAMDGGEPGHGRAGRARVPGAEGARALDDAPDDPRVFGVPVGGPAAAAGPAAALPGARALWPTSGGVAAAHAVDGDAPLNAPPAARKDQVDDPQQWARQSGSRRYQ